MSQHYLQPLFAPQAIAVFGASDQTGTVGGRVYRNLVAGAYGGPIYPIQPGPATLGDRPCFPSLEALPARVDLAILAVPATAAPKLIHACGAAGVKAALILPEDHEDATSPALERPLQEAATRQGVRLLCPRGFGFMRPGLGLNATDSHNTAEPGSLALVSQSGAMCTAILDWACAHRIGFSAVVAVGGGPGVDFGDTLDYLALDPHTRSILVYLEGLRDARRFMSGLRAAARLKPVIAIKAGRYAEGSRAALSHTGALIGSDDVFDAALRRAGVVRAKSIEQMFAAAQLFATRHRLRGQRLAIVTNAGGPGVMATDRAVEQNIRLAEPGPATLAQLDADLPATWSRANPVDLSDAATPEHYAAAVTACLKDEQVDGVLVLLTPQATTQPTQAAAAVIQAAAHTSKPLLACWLGAAQVQEGRELFAHHKIPSFTNPESALEAFAFLAAFHDNQKLLLQAPGPLASQTPPDIVGARLIVEGALSERRSQLSDLETRALLRAFHIPMAPALTVHTPNEALAAAEYLGFPVALKILAPELVHKSDVDGVKLNVEGAGTVRPAYNDLLAAVRARRPGLQIEGVTVEKMYRDPKGRELLVGIVDDPVFGPVIAFGAGGTTVEVLRDRAVALPPLNEHLAETLIQATRTAKLLDAFRNLPPVDHAALVGVLLRLSELACELPEIKELDINPLMADDRGVLALDARIVVQPRPAGRHRYGHMAIHPYPLHWVEHLQLNDGTDIQIRPIRPEDAELERAFVRGLSPEARFFRFMNTIQDLSQDLLIRLTQLDYDRELALLATTVQDGRETALGVARYATNPDGRTAEFALVIADGWQQHGLGTRLMHSLIEAARDKGYVALEGEVLANNTKMLGLMKKLGFASRISPEDAGLMWVSKALLSGALNE
ncbi:acetyltransferase [Methylomagnum ishizawai]|uniref:Acetyltransferase n=1 Tax=Methylomagnum ishizawai TaxID=1760988 RepID=A0A1Y6CZZ8_9GAMM|nr:bifunctional acetate--CoA ligase family protein/GNAT family N-acetyltransferase [Methylomagnum ishizawai]SMF95780.1 acetyltransferase [Methylomagnum ishizawai]